MKNKVISSVCSTSCINNEEFISDYDAFKILIIDQLL